MALADLVHTVAGDGRVGFTGDGVSALSTALERPQGVAVGPDGSLYIADTYSHRIRKVDPFGIISTVAEILVPNSIFVAPSGDLFVTAYESLYRVSPDGEVQSLLQAGGGDYGDGGPASQAGALFPSGVVLDSQGNIYFADGNAHRVRRISPDGIITTVAGIGVRGDGENGSAVSSALNAPVDLAIDGEDNIYIAEAGGDRIRVLSPDGNISTRVSDSSGVSFVEVDERGTLYYGGIFRGQVKQARGIEINVVAGSGAQGFSGDGGAAIDAAFNWPRRSALGPAGNLFIADEQNHRVRKIVLSDHTTWHSDLDGDAWSDVLWRNTATGEVLAWRTGDAQLPYEVAEMDDLAWDIVATGDFDADGATDLFWRHQADGRNMVWPGGRIADFYPVTRLADAEWQVAGTGDFNGDGEDDLLWRHSATGAGSIWPSADSARGYAIIRIKDPNWQVAGIDDFNGDGRSDLLWRNYSWGGNRIWLNADHQSLRPISGLGNLAWDIGATGDFDGDGLSDIVWRNRDSGGAVVWRAGDSTRAWVAGAAPTSMHIAAVADYDGDRKSDLFWRDPVSGLNRIWLGGKVSLPMVVATVPGTQWEVAP